MPRSSNFHSVWGIGGPERGYLRAIFVAAAIGIIAGAITASSLLEGQQEESRPPDAVRLRFTNVTPPSHPENKTQPQSAAPASIPSQSAASGAPAETGTVRQPEPQTASSTLTEPQPPQHCNVAACEQRYQSFRLADCTYQPYAGPRRYCAR